MKGYKLSFTFSAGDLKPEHRMLLMATDWSVAFGFHLSTGYSSTHVHTFYYTNNEQDIPRQLLGKIATDRFKQSVGIHPMSIPMCSYDIHPVE